MKKYFLVMLAFLWCIALSAQSSKKYTLTFDNLETAHVKSVVKITTSIFLSQVQFENDDSNIMIYHTSKVVTKEEVERLLRKNGFTLLNFKSEEEK